MPNLSVSHLGASYGKIRALWDISFDVGDNRITCLLGPNGAGKTTTLRAVLGLIGSDAGTITFNGIELTKLSCEQRVKMGIGMVPEGKQLFPDLSVQDNLASGAYIKTAREKLGDSMEFVFSLFPVLKEKRKQAASMLSGGQQQMVAIGRALMTRPKLLMLDEPTTGLQPSIVRSFFQLLTKLRDQGMTVLIVEQNVYESLLIADAAYILEIGRTVMSGTGSQLLNDPQVRSAYLAT